VLLQVLLCLADDFVEQAASFACAFAKHRRSNTLDVKDVQLYLGQCTASSPAALGAGARGKRDTNERCGRNVHAHALF
jgi:hypothetical protein